MFGLKSMYYSILLLLLVAAIPSTGHRFGRVEEAELSGASPPDFNEKFEKIVANVETWEVRLMRMRQRLPESCSS